MNLFENLQMMNETDNETKSNINWVVFYVTTDYKINRMLVSAKSKEEAEDVVKNELGEKLYKITATHAEEKISDFYNFMQMRDFRSRFHNKRS